MTYFGVSPAPARKDYLLLPLSIFGENRNSGLVPGDRDPNTLPALQKLFVDFFFSFLFGSFALKNGGDFG